MRDMYFENYKTLMKEIGKGKKKKKSKNVLGMYIGRLNVVKMFMLTSSQKSTDSMESSLKIQWHFSLK